MPSPSDVRLSAIIPAYNEESRLPRTLGHAVHYLQSQSYASEVIVVNDGSSDGTERVAREYGSLPIPVRVLAHRDGANHGKGASVRLGMMAARGAYRLFMDADNSTTVDQVERFWPLFDEGYDVVIGSRALKGSVIGVRQAWYKEFAGRIGNWLVRSLAVRGIRDTQAGFKMFTSGAAGRIFPRQTIERWGFDIELLAIARSQGCRVCEIPITWVNAEGSKVAVSDYFCVLGEIRRIRRNMRSGLYR